MRKFYNFCHKYQGIFTFLGLLLGLAGLYISNQTFIQGTILDFKNLIIEIFSYEITINLGSLISILISFIFLLLLFMRVFKKFKRTKNIVHHFTFRNQAPPANKPDIDDHYYDEIFDLQVYKIELTVAPTSYIEHWRCGVKFSKNTTFPPRENRHLAGYPLFHLEKNTGKQILKWSYYDEVNNNTPGEIKITNYKIQPVILKICLNENDAIVNVLDKNKKSVLNNPQTIGNYKYCKLFAWADSRNNFEIKSIIEKQKK